MRCTLSQASSLQDLSPNLLRCDMTNYFSTIQLIGYLAMATTLSAFLQKDDDALRQRAALGSFIWCAHYFLLGALTASVTAGLVGCRQALSGPISRCSTRMQVLAASGFVVVFTGVAGVTWHGPVSLLPWLAAVNATLAFIFMAGVALRRQLVLSDVTLAANALASGSIGGVIAHSVAVLLNARTAWRLQRMTAAA